MMKIDELEWENVVSSNVSKIAFDDKLNDLYVRFLDGSLYVYHGVPLSEFSGLLSAPSVGSYLHRNIKGLYPYERIE